MKFDLLFSPKRSQPTLQKYAGRTLSAGPWPGSDLVVLDTITNRCDKTHDAGMTDL